MSVGQVHQTQQPGAPLDEGTYRRARGSADDQVTFPVTKSGTVLDPR